MALKRTQSQPTQQPTQQAYAQPAAAKTRTKSAPALNQSSKKHPLLKSHIKKAASVLNGSGFFYEIIFSQIKSI